MLLTAAEGVKGKNVTCFDACAFEVKLAGGKYEECKPEEIVVDGNIVSGVNYFGHPKILSKFLDLLGTEVMQL
jgi:protease I